MNLSITYLHTKSMSETTYVRRLTQLIDEVMQHPHKDELIKLAQEQLEDDTLVLPTYS